MNTQAILKEVYDSAFKDELEKLANKKVKKVVDSEPSKLKKGLRIGASVAAGVGAVALTASALRKRPGLIKKVYGKDLKPRMLIKGDRTSEITKVRKVGWSPFKPKMVGQHGEKVRLKKSEIGLLHGFDTYGKVKGKGKELYLSPPGQKSLNQAEDKLIYGKKMYQQGVGAKTWKLSAQDAAKIKRMRKDSSTINFLNKKYGKGKFIFKPRTDFEKDLPATIGKASLVHSGTKSKMTGLLRKNPERFIGQEKLKIKKEYRIRTLNGKVVAIVPRYPGKNVLKVEKNLNLIEKNKGGMGLVPLSTKTGKGKKIKKFIKKNPQSFDLGGSGKRINTMAFDVAEIKGKKPSYKVIEANVITGDDLDNPYISGKLYKKLTGKASGTEKTIKLTGAAGLAGASGYAAYPYASNLAEKLKKGKESGKARIIKRNI